MSMAIEVLQYARTLLERPDGWTQGVGARDASGEPVSPYDPRACRFCLFGALERAGKVVGDRDALHAAYALVCAVLGFRFPSESLFLIDWNDIPGRSQRDILELLDRAIARARS